jgi:hypothetical protein
LPEFWVGDPNKWFESIEGTFTFLNIGSSQTKYQMAIGVIPGDCLDVVRDQVHRNPGEYPDPYGELKMRLTGTFGNSRWQLAQELISHLDLGDLKPSVLMSMMQALLPPEDKSDALFMALFLRKLPITWRNQLAACSTNT